MASLKIALLQIKIFCQGLRFVFHNFAHFFSFLVDWWEPQHFLPVFEHNDSGQLSRQAWSVDVVSRRKVFQPLKVYAGKAELPRRIPQTIFGPNLSSMVARYGPIHVKFNKPHAFFSIAQHLLLHLLFLFSWCPSWPVILHFLLKFLDCFHFMEVIGSRIARIRQQ